MQVRRVGPGRAMFRLARPGRQDDLAPLRRGQTRKTRAQSTRVDHALTTGRARGGGNGRPAARTMPEAPVGSWKNRRSFCAFSPARRKARRAGGNPRHIKALQGGTTGIRRARNPFVAAWTWPRV